MDGAFQIPWFQLVRLRRLVVERGSLGANEKGRLAPPLSVYSISISILSSWIVSLRQVLEFLFANGISGLRGIP